MYRCVAGSVEGFVRQLAVAYIGRGYWFYVTGYIPPDKAPEPIDQKLIAKYEIDLSRWTRARRKKLGLANVQYLRYGRFFVLIATPGRHCFFEEEAGNLRDIREEPIRFHGYSIGYRRGWQDQKWHPSVRLELAYYQALQRRFEGLAVQRSAEHLAGALRALPIEPWAPVCRQLGSLLRRVNRQRKTAGLELLPATCLPPRRRPRSPFAPPAMTAVHRAGASPPPEVELGDSGTKPCASSMAGGV